MSVVMIEAELPLKELHAGRDNPRDEVGDVTELAASIKEEGLLNPLTVQKDQLRGGFYIVAGERRWTACRMIGLDPVPCRIREPQGAESALKPVEIGVHENYHHKKLSAMELARAFGRMRDEDKKTMAQIAKQFGVNPSTVSRHLALLELSAKSQADVDSGKLSVEIATAAVERTRAKARKKQGHKPVNVGWEPPHFTWQHSLAKKANTMCNAREHNERRRVRGIACEVCWETVIRQDENKAQYTAYKDAGFEVPFQPPVFVPSQSDSEKKLPPMDNGSAVLARSLLNNP